MSGRLVISLNFRSEFNMLLQLHIQNYAIIEEIIIDFSEGLQVITGETGAGKSIIAGALSLVLGRKGGYIHSQTPGSESRCGSEFSSVFI